MKTFTLFKRDSSGRRIPVSELPQHRDRPWFFAFIFRGKAYARALETADAGIAQQRARIKYNEIRNAIIADELDRLDHTKLRHPVHASLARLFEVYRTSPVKANPKTREANIDALMIMLRRLNPGVADAELHKRTFVQLVNGETAEKWFQLENLKPQTANSLWRQAASLCAPRARFAYDRAKMDHPCLKAFAETGRVCQRPVSKGQLRPPADEIVAATLKAWEQLEDRNLFLAIGHELAFGLRAGEVTQARTTWWQVKYNTPMLCATGQFKHNHEGYFELPALDPFYTIMRTKALNRRWLDLTQDTFIISGSDSYRADGIEREVSSFLREQGWTTTKTNHALRAYAGGLVCLKYGVYKAKEFLRHSSVKVTEQHYLYLMKNPLVDAIRDTCPAAWATLQPASPILTVLPQAVSQ